MGGMGVLAGELAWRVPCSLAIGLARAKADMGWIDQRQSPPRLGTASFPNAFRASQRRCCFAPTLRAPIEFSSNPGRVAARCEPDLSLTSFPPTLEDEASTANAYYVAGCRLIIRVAGIRPWCHFLRTRTPLETH